MLLVVTVFEEFLALTLLVQNLEVTMVTVELI